MAASAARLFFVLLTVVLVHSLAPQLNTYKHYVASPSPSPPPILSIKKSRVSTVLESVREAGVGYRLLNLLAFYRATVGQIAGEESPLMEALTECRKNADDTFRHAMKREVYLDSARRLRGVFGVCSVWGNIFGRSRFRVRV